MVVWKKTIAGCEVKIHNVDHLPPHCHARIDNRDVKVDLRTLEVLHPPPYQIPSKLRKGIRYEIDALLEAWEDVKVIPPWGSPGNW